MKNLKLISPFVLRRVAKVVLIIGVTGAIILWLTFQHKPSWYRPTLLDDAGKKIARRESTNFFDSIGDQMFRGEPFVLNLTQQQVNEWLSLIPYILSDVDAVDSGRITQPAIQFDNDIIQIGVHYQKGGLQTILNVTFEVKVLPGGQEIELGITGIRGGSLPAPKSILEPLISRLMNKNPDHKSTMITMLLGTMDSANELFSCVQRRNRFVWPNGKRMFKFESITIRNGGIRLSIKPL